MSLLAGITLFMILQLGIGVWVSRRIRTESDYILAGRQLGYVLTTFSIFATWFGAETIVGSAGRAYRDGVSLGSAEPFGYGLCLILMGLIFAAPLWRRQLTTLADLYRQRFSPAAERIAALILIPSSVLWAAAQMRAFGQVLSISGDGMNVETALAIAAGFTILYTAVGGMLADAITDLLQGLILMVGLVVLLIAVLPHVGAGAGQIAIDPTRVTVLPRDESVLALLERWAIPIGGSVIATELVGRVLAARSPDVARHSSFAAGAIYIVIGTIPLLIGTLGPQIAPNLADGEQLLPYVARNLLPTGMYVVFVGAFISAILSTVNTTLLVPSSLLSHNIVTPLLRITDERTKVLVARVGVLTFGIGAYLFARKASGVFELVEEASAFGSAGALVTVSFGLFTSWGGARTAIATLAAGVIAYLAASVAELQAPFLISLGASLGCYLLGAAWERQPAMV